MGALTTLAASIHTELDGGATPHEVGAKHLHTPKAPPYVVWVHVEAQHEAGSTHTGPQQNGAGQVSKVCATRALAVMVHIWGETADATEVLLHGLMAAAHNVAAGSYKPGSDTWPTQEEHELLTHGELAVWRATFDVPVNAWTQETVEITGANDPDTGFVEEL